MENEKKLKLINIGSILIVLLFASILSGAFIIESEGNFMLVPFIQILVFLTLLSYLLFINKTEFFVSFISMIPFYIISLLTVMILGTSIDGEIASLPFLFIIPFSIFNCLVYGIGKLIIKVKK